MKDTRIIMGMPVTIDIVGGDQNTMSMVFNYFKYIDEKFSTYKDTSEIMKINRGEIAPENYSEDMKEIFNLADRTKMQTHNYFNIEKSDGTIDPSGIVKGWAIHKAGLILKEQGFDNFCLDVGGDIETSGSNSEGNEWKIGIRNPFNTEEVIKILYNKNKGVATSGIYIRGNHIYNPNEGNISISDIVSMTVIGPDIYEADRFATASFAMGRDGIYFIDKMPGFEGYMIDRNGIATMTAGFEQYVK